MILAMCLTSQVYAQDTPVKPKGDKITIKIGSDGIDVSSGSKDIIGDAQKKKKGKSRTSGLVLDFGFANFIDNTPANAAYNANLYDLKTAKSTAFNIQQQYGFSIVRSHLYVVTGLGLNVNNYRYEGDLQFGKPSATLPPSVYYTDYEPLNLAIATIKKSKVATNHLTVPLMLQAKLGEGRKKFVIAGGLSGGYLIKGWNKAVYTNNKDKDKINYVFNPYALNAIGEIGIDNRIRFFASYGLTPMHNQPLKHNAVTFGIRCFGL
jgi:hypothetical protein